MKGRRYYGVRMKKNLKEHPRLATGAIGGSAGKGLIYNLFKLLYGF